MYEWQQMARPETLTDIQRAARFFYLQKLSFGGRVVGQSYGTSATTPPRLNLLRIEEDLSQAHLRLVGVAIEHLDWADVITRYDRPDTFFYCDPPYFGTEGYGVDFCIDQYRHLAELARSIAGKMIVSVNDVPEMREVFSDLPMEGKRITYTVSVGAGAPRKELIIRSGDEGFGGNMTLL